jgi:hypothetical protein
MVGIRSASSTGSLNPLSRLFYHCSPETEMRSLPDWSEAKKLWIFDAERIYGGWAEASGLVNKNEQSRATQVTKLRTFIRYGRIFGASFVEDWRKGSPKLTFEQLLTELRRRLGAYYA